VVATGEKGTKVVAAGEEAHVVVVAAPVEAGGARPRRKGVKYNSPSKLDMNWMKQLLDGQRDLNSQKP
jgi:hypothetical protein